MSSLPIIDYRNISYMDIHNRLVYGFEIWWKEVSCGICKGKEKCYLPSEGFSCPTESIFHQIITQIISLWWFILMMIAGLIIARTVLCNETPTNYTYSTDETQSSSTLLDSSETISLLLNSG
ncbi:hypothetical protein OIU79_025191 [Salix purpurea]|uniref:Uncharacterized protein n=1 Tax=Salix purpurea TaxID=77065 RepID=A0A9Q1A711_SALPP|nr:hypothetical protein OIU79_025191 [Salix purpurea]